MEEINLYSSACEKEVCFISLNVHLYWISNLKRYILKTLLADKVHFIKCQIKKLYY